MLLRFYKPLQNWLLKRADKIVGTTPVYLQESPYLKEVQEKTVCLPIGVEAMRPSPEAVESILQRYQGKNIVFSLGRLVTYKGYRYLIEAARYLDDRYVILIGGTGELKDELENEIATLGVQDKVKLLGRISDEDPVSYTHLDVYKRQLSGLSGLIRQADRKESVSQYLNHGKQTEFGRD